MRTPFKCPVCGGRGLVDECRACHGTGIIWGENITEVDFEDFQSDDFMYNPDNNDNTSVT